MTHRSPYHLFVRTVLAALGVAAVATLAAPVGASAVLVAQEYSLREAIAPVPSPVFTVSASPASQLQSRVTESSNITPAAGLTRGVTVQMYRLTRLVPSHAPWVGGVPGEPTESGTVGRASMMCVDTWIDYTKSRWWWFDPCFHRNDDNDDPELLSGDLVTEEVGISAPDAADHGWIEGR